MKQIIITPHHVLQKAAEPVEKIDNQIKKILEEMEETLVSTKDPRGIGLAAPQIGYPLQIFAVKPRENSKVSFYINPKIIKESEILIEIPKRKAPLEGCLSIPNTWGFIKRKKEVTLTFQDLQGKKRTKTFKDFLAIIVQHEMDHLKGVLFTQRVLEQGGKLYEIVKVKKGKDRLKELPL